MNTVLSYFNNTVKTFPDNVAVEDINGTITYKNLDVISDYLAANIISTIGASVRNLPILVFLPKQVESVISYVGILKTGNPYVPIDYQMPMQRLQVMIDNLNPIAIVADQEALKKLDDSGIKTSAKLLEYTGLVKENTNTDQIHKKINETIDVDPAYIMYTSGTTGVPKGVVISHRGIEDYANWLVKEFDFSEDTVFGLQSGFHFDNSVLDMFCSFFTGGKMVIIPEVLFMYPSKLLPYLNEKKINTIFWVPTVMISVADSGALDTQKPEYLKNIIFAGEVMPNKQLNIWRKALPTCVYANLYGPTEITVDCLFYIVDREFEDYDPLPIGKDCPNSKVLLLKEDNTPAGVNEQGEICVLGCCVGLGYWNNPEQTQKAFVQNPLNSDYREIMYRTGDIAYRTDEGLVMYVGRKDSQFKLRGNRIELGEIEQNALVIDGIERVCAIFDETNQEIIVFVKSKSSINLRKFNNELKKYIPKYMLPSKLFIVEDFPYNKNNKIDRMELKNKYLAEEF